MKILRKSYKFSKNKIIFFFFINNNKSTDAHYHPHRVLQLTQLTQLIVSKLNLKCYCHLFLKLFMRENTKELVYLSPCMPILIDFQISCESKIYLHLKQKFSVCFQVYFFLLSSCPNSLKIVVFENLEMYVTNITLQF